MISEKVTVHFTRPYSKAHFGLVQITFMPWFKGANTLKCDQAYAYEMETHFLLSVSINGFTMAELLTSQLSLTSKTCK